MNTLVVLAGLVVLAASNAVPGADVTYKTKTVDATFIERQRKVLSLFEGVKQIESEAEYYKNGEKYDIEANLNNYTNKKAVEEFLVLYRAGLMPKRLPFSVFYNKMKVEAIALFDLLYYAKDFDTFYRTAEWARVHVNEGQFLYAYYIALIHREDTKDFVLPATYEVFPQLYVNTDILNKITNIKMQGKIYYPENVRVYGITKEGEDFVFSSNYSNYLSYSNQEQRLAYFTEDIGLNSYYYYFNALFPSWMEGKFFGALKEHRGELFYLFIQRILARYYMERLTNGLGKIPVFSWRTPFQTGYKPFLYQYYPFSQRTNEYDFVIEENYEELRFIEAYEKDFIEFLENGRFKAYNQEIDFHNPKAINFVGNYWQSNYDLYEKTLPRNYRRSYQAVARRMLGAAPELYNTYTFMPSALDFYQTSLRDPAFYQLYSRMIKYILEFKKYLQPYTNDQLQYAGVKINDVKVDPLVTYFDYFEFDVTNGIYKTSEEYKSSASRYIVRQPRLNHKPFTVTIDVDSNVAANAIVKIFIGPKYDENGYPIGLEDNWMNFMELDWFKHTLVQGKNKIQRKSKEFMYYQDDWVSVTQLYKDLAQNKIPAYERYIEMPDRLMLPKGTKSGFPFQIFAIIYPSETEIPDHKFKKDYRKDMKPLSYPFDRPPNSVYFNQPNMFFEDVLIYHEGEQFSYKYNIPGYIPRKTEAPKI